MSRVLLLLTGGIGSGKSTVGDRLAGRGARVIDADRVGHRVLEEEAQGEVAERWPEAVGPEGVDRRVLGERVFRDPEELRRLEAVTHPLIRRRIEEMVEEAAEGVVVVEVPLARDFMGPGWLRVVVDAPEEMRRARLAARGMPEGEVERRMAVQPGRSEWLAGADYVIDNSGGPAELEREVDRLWAFLTRNADRGPTVD